MTLRRLIKRDNPKQFSMPLKKKEGLLTTKNNSKNSQKINVDEFEIAFY